MEAEGRPDPLTAPPGPSGHRCLQTFAEPRQKPADRRFHRPDVADDRLELLAVKVSRCHFQPCFQPQPVGVFFLVLDKNELFSLSGGQSEAQNPEYPLAGLGLTATPPLAFHLVDR